ncbi:hypothetical protein RJ639_045893 [Escallonia herrerae]|uniref:Pentatricopeptide repeat-containing protein n=1 Tax=Escallonia herrerae TaxID=1293975 RepID=A0AA89AZ26_9ASTE|nr:hypothetical protein RJ639_045893 [Escallonia herrerae]
MPTRDIAVWNAMIHGYFGNKRVEDAVKFFDKMPRRNVISWTSMISGLDRHGRSDEALVHFQQMVGYGVQGTPNTYSCVITACASALAFGLGAGIHGHVIKLNYATDQYIAASMITFYANCKKIENSCKIFNEKYHKNVAVWTALLTGYGLNSRHEDALKACKLLEQSYFSKFTVMVAQKKRLAKFFKVHNAWINASQNQVLGCSCPLRYARLAATK